MSNIPTHPMVPSYPSIVSGGFLPLSLFANGEQGAWFDPSDLSSMFQDAAGTIPADYGQPVGLILDKSGNGNHASQATATARPTLGRMPVGGRRNLIVSSEDLTAPVWSSSVSPDTSWSLEPDGFTRVSFTAVSSDRRQPRLQAGVFSGITTGEVRYIRALFRPGPGITTIALGIGGFAQFSHAAYNTQTGVATTYAVSNPGTTLVETAKEVSPGVWELVVKYTAGDSPRSAVNAHFGTGSAQDLRLNSPVGYCDIGFVQAELTPTPYQRVGASRYDVTEDGVQSLTYLEFDGVDDVLRSSIQVDGIGGPFRATLAAQGMNMDGSTEADAGIRHDKSPTDFSRIGLRFYYGSTAIISNHIYRTVTGEDPFYYRTVVSSSVQTVNTDADRLAPHVFSGGFAGGQQFVQSDAKPAETAPRDARPTITGTFQLGATGLHHRIFGAIYVIGEGSQENTTRCHHYMASKIGKEL